MKEILALVVLSMVLAAPDWAAIEKKYKEILDEESDSTWGVKGIVHMDVNDHPDAATFIVHTSDESAEKLEAFYKDNIKPEIDGNSLTPEKAEDYCNQMQQIREEYRTKMKPEIEKMAANVQEYLKGLWERVDTFRKDKMNEILEALRA